MRQSDVDTRNEMLNLDKTRETNLETTCAAGALPRQPIFTRVRRLPTYPTACGQIKELKGIGGNL